MAQVQQQFEQFHEAIKLGRFEESQTLREKRDIIRGKLEERLSGVFDDHDELCPTFRFRDQGSYEMGTGIKPVSGDYDIDQGVYFDASPTAYPDPVLLKQRVHEALEGHTKDVQLRRSCVTVFYQREGEPIYHVDLAVYSEASQNADGQSRIAKGKANSAAEHRIWEISDPETLADTIFERFEGLDRAQFRRVVRYLKRWKDEHFPSDGWAAPPGIALTVAAYHDLETRFLDSLTGKPDDLAALRTLVSAMLVRFQDRWDADEQKLVRRIAILRPVPPSDDLLGRMTAKQMGALEGELIRLQDALSEAADAVDPVEACKRLQEAFGDDFPVPAKKDTASQHAPAIVSSSSSA